MRKIMILLCLLIFSVFVFTGTAFAAPVTFLQNIEEKATIGEYPINFHSGNQETAWQLDFSDFKYNVPIVIDTFGKAYLKLPRILISSEKCPIGTAVPVYYHENKDNRDTPLYIDILEVVDNDTVSVDVYLDEYKIYTSEEYKDIRNRSLIKINLPGDVLLDGKKLASVRDILLFTSKEAVFIPVLRDADGKEYLFTGEKVGKGSFGEGFYVYANGGKNVFYHKWDGGVEGTLCKANKIAKCLLIPLSNVSEGVFK